MSENPAGRAVFGKLTQIISGLGEKEKSETLQERIIQLKTFEDLNQALRHELETQI